MTAHPSDLSRADLMSALWQLHVTLAERRDHALADIDHRDPLSPWLSGRADAFQTALHWMHGYTLGAYGEPWAHQPHQTNVKPESE